MSIRLGWIIACALLLLGLASCTTTKLPQKQSDSTGYPGHYKVGNPYKVADEWYYPKEDVSYKAEGIASWYGPNFHGKRTANGDYYNQYTLTAAHPTLPLPSMVRITNLENGRSVIAMVNDRGPFSKKRLIDVSERVADLLGFKRKGSSKVRVEYLHSQTEQLLERLGMQRREGAPGTRKGYAPERVRYVEEDTLPSSKQTFSAPIETAAPAYRAPAAPRPADPLLSQTSFTPGGGSVKPLYIQAGAYKNKTSALSMAKALSRYAAVDIAPVNFGGAVLYRVRLGPVQKHEAQDLLAKVIDLGNTNAIIVGNNS